ncbi:SNF2 domain-containing helicase domain-containing protein [Babesia ovis]|uniref:SNF2 domain-containing helicase domain-containing protein n=1 Tax=Babesia ovis TaxID=5869 RepID=A0A9W5WVB9_BABOV|nr:SNF2 domain-containing helicase domain-containing protein [Babesia ovis]
MVLDIDGVKEVDSKVLEEQAYNNVEEVVRLQSLSKRLQQKINQSEPSDKQAKKYKAFVGKIRHIINRIVARSLGNDDILFEDESDLNYEFIGQSKLRIGEDVVDIPEDEDSTRDNQSTSEFKCVFINDQAAFELSDNIFSPAKVFENLYPHQREGLKWLVELYHRRHGGILADEMGLGKTVTVLSFLNALIFSAEIGKIDIQGGFDVLIICPITLISQWKSEIGKWVPLLKPFVFHGALGSFNDHFVKSKSKRYRGFITSYETFRAHVETINAHYWSYVILDEGQKIRNPDAAVTLAVKTVGTPHRILLSGSPIQNNLIEFWSLLDFVAPGHLGTLPLFIEHIVNPIMRSNNGCSSSVAFNCALRLRTLVRPFIRRNVKSEFAESLNLPKKSEHIIMCKLTPAQYEMYMALLKAACNFVSKDDSYSMLVGKESKRTQIKKLKSNRVLVLLTLLRKTCNHPDLVLKERPEDFGNVSRSAKLKVALDIVAKWEATGHKVLMFTQTIQMLNIIHDTVIQCYGAHRIARIDGEVSIKRRATILESFEHGNDIFLLLLTTRVGGVGLNLTCANRVLIFDPDWNPMTDSQARERSYRIGQSKDVVVYRLISAHTVEEKIYHRQIYKFYLSERILTDPSIVGFRYLPAADLLVAPPKPSTDEEVGGYLNKITQQINSIDFEMDIRQVSNSKDIYQRPSDVEDSEGANPILNSIFDQHEVEGVIKHDDIEKACSLDYGATSCLIADNAVKVLKRSLKERNAYDISVPTWTGENGQAAAPVSCQKYKYSTNTSYTIQPLYVGVNRNKVPKSGLGKEMDTRSMKRLILDYFRDGPKIQVPTGEVIDYFGPLIPGKYCLDAAHKFLESHTELFKLTLKGLCDLRKSNGRPNYWVLKEKFMENK